MKKKGQFFLIAALLIAGITIGFGTLYNTAKIERQDVQVFELSEQLHSEIQQAYDSGLIYGKSDEEIKQRLEYVAAYYAQQNPDSSFAIVYGDERGVSTIYNDGSKISASSFKSNPSEKLPESNVRGVTESNKESSTVKEGRSEYTKSGEKISKVKVALKFKETTDSKQGQVQREEEKTIDKEFDIQPGQHFYVVVRKKQINNEEQTVITRA